MAEIKVNFGGEFAKHIKFSSYVERLKENKKLAKSGFIEELYQKAEQEITTILGKKEKYSVEEAARYFQIKYGAYRIPYEYVLYYEDPCLEYELIPCEIDARGDGRPEFDYSKKSGQKNITLVVDTVYNKELRKRYPDIERLENRRKEVLIKEAENLLITTEKDYPSLEMDKEKMNIALNYDHREGADMKRRMANNEMGNINPVIVIGYYKEHEINSMYLENNYICYEALTPEYQTPILDIQYEFWYFYNHS